MLFDEIDAGVGGTTAREMGKKLAALSAGPSLIPSPVIATTLPARWRARTISSLCDGVTEENTCTFSARPLSTSGSIDSSSAESIVRSSGPSLKFSCRPIVWAVAL
mgnify:CR=1 FL=1